MTRLSTLLLALSTFALTSAATTAEAQNAAQPDAAKRFLERKHDAVNRVLRSEAGAQRDAQLDRLLDGMLAYDVLARRALASHWDQRSEAERTEFTRILEKLVERSYRANLERTLAYEITYGEARRRGASIFVTTEARSRDNRRAPPVTIEYELTKTDHASGWKVVNVTTDGQSLVESYRSQFHQIIESDGWDALLSRMRARLSDD